MDGLNMATMSLHSSDALPNREIQCFTQLSKKAIDARVLRRVEQELEEFEKISILFLLSADTAGMYEKVIALCKNIEERPGIIAEFIDNRLDVWGEKLVEALFIIDNREILRNLGCSQSILANRCFDIPRYSVKIHTVSKVLYKLFESLGREKTKVLLKYIYEEDQIARQFEDSHYLELHALYWLHIDYITISHDGGNLSKLLRHLKRMDYYGESIYHDIEDFSTPSSQSDSRIVARSTLVQYPEPPTRNDAQFANEIGITRQIKKGKCIIINEVRFPAPYERREGSDSDRDALRRTFSAMGFDILTREDLTKDELMNFLKQISDDFDDNEHDCLVVCILTHGYEGGIVTSDGKEILNDDIEDKVCSWKLRNTIKLLIVQACQGKTTGDASSQKSEYSTDGSNYENNLRFRNFARFMSTMNGFASIRHRKNGSWFVQTLCEVLLRRGRITIFDWTTAVTQMVGSKKGCVNGCKAASQIPEFKTRLEAQIYFPPCTESPNVEPAAVARR